MKFFVDENVPKIVSKYLMSLNHEVIDIRGTNKEGIDDFSIFQLSQDNKAIFISTVEIFFIQFRLSSYIIPELLSSLKFSQIKMLYWRKLNGLWKVVK